MPASPFAIACPNHPRSANGFSLWAGPRDIPMTLDRLCYSRGLCFDDAGRAGDFDGNAEPLDQRSLKPNRGILDLAARF